MNLQDELKMPSGAQRTYMNEQLERMFMHKQGVWRVPFTKWLLSAQLRQEATKKTTSETKQESKQESKAPMDESSDERDSIMAEQQKRLHALFTDKKQMSVAIAQLPRGVFSMLVPVKTEQFAELKEWDPPTTSQQALMQWHAIHEKHKTAEPSVMEEQDKRKTAFLMSALPFTDYTQLFKYDVREKIPVVLCAMTTGYTPVARLWWIKISDEMLTSASDLSAAIGKMIQLKCWHCNKVSGEAPVQCPGDCRLVFCSTQHRDQHQCSAPLVADIFKDFVQTMVIHGWTPRLLRPEQ